MNNEGHEHHDHEARIARLERYVLELEQRTIHIQELEKSIIELIKTIKEHRHG